MASEAEENPYAISLIPPKSLRRAFLRAARHADAGDRVQELEAMHITLEHVHIPKKKSKADLLRQLENVKFPAFTVKITDADTFNRAGVDSNDRSKVAWLRPDGVSSYDIQELRNNILKSLRDAGFPGSGQAMYRPHMTILWYDFNKAAADVRNFLQKCEKENFPSWHVDRFYLTRKRSKEELEEANDNSKPLSKIEIVASFKLTGPKP